MNAHFLAAAIAALTLTTAAYGQYKPVGDDGIAASPKVRQMLEERKTRAAVAAPAMGCKKCADVRSVRVREHAKAAEIMTATRQVTYSHGCAKCETRVHFVGHGKDKRQVATHKCNMKAEDAAHCCAAK